MVKCRTNCDLHCFNLDVDPIGRIRLHVGDVRVPKHAERYQSRQSLSTRGQFMQPHVVIVDGKWVLPDTVMVRKILRGNTTAFRRRLSFDRFR